MNPILIIFFHFSLLLKNSKKRNENEEEEDEEPDYVYIYLTPKHPPIEFVYLKPNNNENFVFDQVPIYFYFRDFSNFN